MYNSVVDVNCLESENDSEMSEILCRKPVELLDVPEKPLSPVLSRSRVNRRNLFNKKPKHKKSRVNLSQIFQNDKLVKEDTTQLQVKEFDDDSLTVSQTESLMDRIEKLEEIESNRQNFHKLFTSNKQDDFCFKKPILTPVKHKKIKINSQSSKEYDNNVVDTFEEDKIYFKNLTDYKCVLSQSPGFQTATGNKIDIAENQIKSYSLLFNDILNYSQGCDVTRCNKYRFLSKDKPPEKFAQPNKKSSSSVEQPEQRTEDSVNRNTFDKQELLLTQGISDTQMLSVASTILDKSVSVYSSELKCSEFTGFTHEEISESKVLLHDLHMVFKSIDNFQDTSIENQYFSKKHKLNDENSPPSKRLKQENDSKYINSSASSKVNTCKLDEMLFDVTITQDNSLKAGLAMGFSKASGKSIALTDNSINKAKKMFSNMNMEYNVTIESTAESPNRIDCKTKLELLNEAIKCLETKKQASACKNKINKSETSTRTSLSAGFSKASGKYVNLSAGSIFKAKQVFEVVGNGGSSKSLLDQNQDDTRSGTISNYSRDDSVLGKSKIVTSLASGSETDLKNFINSNKSESSASGNMKSTENEFNQRQGQKRKLSQVGNFKLDPPDSMQQESPQSITRITSRNKLALLDKAIKDVETSKDNYSNQLVHTFGEVSDLNFGTSIKDNGIRGFSKASGVAINLKEASLQRAKSLFSDIEIEPLDRITGAPSQNKLKLVDDAVKHAEIGINSVNNVSNCQQGKFGESNEIKCVISCDIDQDLSERNISRISSRGKLKLLDEGLKNYETDVESANCNSNYQEPKFRDIKCDTSTMKKDICGFTRASGVAIHLTEKSMQKAKSLFSDIENQEESITRITSRNKLKLLDDAIKEAEKNMDITEIDAPRPLLLSSFKPKPIGLRPTINKSNEIPTKDTHLNSGPAYSTPIKANQNRTFAKSSRKKLGVSSYQVIPISQSKLHKAKLLFGEDLPEPSPIKPCHTSTPLKPTMLMGSFSSMIDTTTLDVDSNNDNIVLSPDAAFVIVPPTKVNLEEKVKEFGEETDRLQARIRVLIERQKVLHSIKIEKNDSEKTSRVGALYNYKRNSERRSLSTLSRNCIEDNDFVYVNPRNAENFHFKETSPILTTADGAIVIPSIKDLIGLPEIELGFYAMPGVDSRLLPKGWLKNHYKWVVWKLACYEHTYPDDLKGCLSVENVIQQLKYRYDREIDKAERPALRRILEKDDAPQKRLILCVSDIKTSEHELELTDGWYPVRTVVDELLYRQVTSGRIRVGTKLVITGAELLNCDGCHPLEVTDLTCLKINYNCTRRAIWHAKLGYQPFPGPFPIRIATVHPLGGAIGAIRICVVRTYPIKYLERMGTNTVWRNQKAEERRAQEWENEQSKRMEKIEEGIRKEFSENLGCPNQVTRLRNITGEQLSSISNPKVLFEIVETSNDPDNILENLTALQRSTLMDYRRRMHSKKQQEINARIKENVEKLKLVKRDVSAVMRLLVVDVFAESSGHHNFFIWHPNESHGHLLKEKTLLTVYNIQPRKNGDLNSTSKTVFKPTSGNFVFNENYTRQVIDIENLPLTIFSPSFKDFDTVGIVVGTTVETNKQEVWLTGLSGRLLLVEVIQGPNQCLLLDNLRRGNATTACNLLYCGFKDDIVYAMANHYTIFSSYSQYKHLQEGLDMFKTKLPKDLNVLLDDCDNHIDLYKLNSSATAKFTPFARLDDSDEDTLIQSRLTSTDVALSLIDIDNLV